VRNQNYVPREKEKRHLHYFDSISDIERPLPNHVEDAKAISEIIKLGKRQQTWGNGG